jgi:hypothetical protein
MLSKDVIKGLEMDPGDDLRDSNGRGISRRSFIGRIGMVSIAAGMVGSASTALAESDPPQTSVEPGISGSSNTRVGKSFALRTSVAVSESQVPVPSHTSNGDEQRYSDKSASFSKCLLQDGVAIVNKAAWRSFKKALRSGKNSDFEAIILGGTRTLNGPQGAYAFDMIGSDSSQFGNAPSAADPTGPAIVPPFDEIASPAYGTQLIEQYWAALLRDVPFTDYDGNAIAAAAAAELGGQATYRGPRESNGDVTPGLLFRGNYPGETIGPYVSQLMITPTNMGQQPMDQLMVTYLADINYMTDTTTFLQVQNGIDTGLINQPDPVRRYLHNGRGLAAYTHVDVLFQAYFTGLLVLLGLNAPLNPGNPYVNSRTQNGFCTFGAPDFAAAMGMVAARALQRVWYQKWLIHLTHRPEAGGGVLHENLTGNPSGVQATLASNVLNSQAVEQTFSQYGTYLLPQAFPEGSPSHPSYPTGHGTVGGACITMLKFFFDENYVIPDPLVPSIDGTSLLHYTGSDARQITVGGELNKIARNVTFGHGVHAGIHWRTDSDYSMLLGEAMAISYLNDLARTYHEKFSITFTKLDGHQITISNE